MTGRTNNKKYIEIYKKYHKSIPVDEDGRTYEIHHIDGNWQNNDISNLVALSIREHYDVHYSQGDWGACFYIMQRMKKTPAEIASEISEISKKVQAERIKNKTHHFQKRPDGSSVASDRAKNNTNPLQRRSDNSSVTSDRVKNGTHNFLNQDNKQRLDNLLYTFKNLDTGEEITMTRKDFVEKYNLHAHQGNLSSMINRKTRDTKKGKSLVAKHVKRWVIIQE
jgi:hypothetical protein